MIRKQKHWQLTTQDMVDAYKAIADNDCLRQSTRDAAADYAEFVSEYGCIPGGTEDPDPSTLLGEGLYELARKRPDEALRLNYYGDQYTS